MTGADFFVFDDRRGKLIARTAAGGRVIDETITRHVANQTARTRSNQPPSVLTVAEQGGSTPCRLA